MDPRRARGAALAAVALALLLLAHAAWTSSSAAAAAVSARVPAAEMTAARAAPCRLAARGGPPLPGGWRAVDAAEAAREWPEVPALLRGSFGREEMVVVAAEQQVVQGLNRRLLVQSAASNAPEAWELAYYLPLYASAPQDDLVTVSRCKLDP